MSIQSIIPNFLKRSRSNNELNEPPINSFEAYGRRIQDPAVAERLRSNVEHIYPVTYRSSQASVIYNNPNVPESSYRPPRSTKQKGVLKVDILTIDVMCKMMNEAVIDPSLSTQFQGLTNEIGGPMVSVVTTLAAIEASKIHSRVVEGVENLPDEFKAALHGSLENVSPTVANIVSNGPAAMVAAYGTYQTVQLAKRGYDAWNKKPTLTSSCLQTYRDLCEQDKIACSEINCRGTYVGHHADRGIYLDRYVALPQGIIVRHSQVAQEFEQLIKDTPQEDQIFALDDLVPQHFEVQIADWLSVVQLKANLANEVGLVISLLHYVYELNTVAWRKVIASIMRVFLDRLFNVTYKLRPDALPPSNAVVLYTPPSPEAAPLSQIPTVFQTAIRSMIIIMSCNPQDLAFSATMTDALLANPQITSVIDLIAIEVHKELLVTVNQVNKRNRTAGGRY